MGLLLKRNLRIGSTFSYSGHPMEQVASSLIWLPGEQPGTFLVFTAERIDVSCSAKPFWEIWLGIDRIDPFVRHPVL